MCDFIVAQRQIGHAQVTDAWYPAGWLDARHDHRYDHVAIVIEGSVLELRGHFAQRHGPGWATHHGRAESHALYFPHATRVVTVSTRYTRANVRQHIDIPASPPFDSEPALELLLERIQSATSRVPNRRPPQWLVRSVKTFPWTSNVPLEETARRAGISRAHFDRVFRSFFGKPPRAYRRERKLAHACRLLLESSDTLSTVSLTSGFYDQSHFTTAFTRAYGVSPKRFRRMFAHTSYKT
jgi:AraC-like DNA-binding protein